MRNANSLTIVAGALLLSAALRSFAADSVITAQWNFSSDANPAPSGSGTAAIKTGAFSGGWQADLPALAGGGGGYWDLGQSGTITLSFPNGLATNATVKSLKVKVTQWWDGGIYDDFASVSVAGAHTSSSSAGFSTLGNLGGWTTDETLWTPDANASLKTISLGGSSKGTIIDSVTVEATVSTAPPPQLTMQMMPNGQVRISWSSAYSTMALESSDNPAGGSWTAVNATVQIGQTDCSVNLTPSGPPRFYRLRQP